MSDEVTIYIRTGTTIDINCTDSVVQLYICEECENVPSIII